ncbi:oligosaccharide flippase family protein [Candidatus Roizmanbacteria bacterium]|nr:oligosaccharide flippase family protein [Candidatus Roizmanbacteria bacterium]
MEDEIKKIKTRGLLSAGSLIFQSSFSAGLGFVAFFILTLKSSTYLLGIYNTVLAMMSFFNYLTNLGLAAAIIQKKEVEDKDLSTAFFIQLVLTTLAVVVGFALTGYLFKFYKDLPHRAVYLYWSLLGSFFFLSLKTIPSVLLEKRVKIYKVVFAQLLENTVFYSAVIIFSLMGWDIYSLVIAVIVRSVVGLITIYVMQPWFPKFIFSASSAKSLLRYGIPFQGNSFLALIKDDLLIIYLGGVLGFQKLGIVTFAKKYAEFSIRLVMDNLNRVFFPIFARFQNEKDLLKKSLEKMLFYQSLLVLPTIIGAVFVFDNLLRIVPGYFLKWQPALFSFWFFSLSAIFVSFYSPLINLFNAIGKVKLSLYFMIFFTVITWILIPPMVKYFGYQAISVSFFVMSLSFIIVVLVAKKKVKFSFLKAIEPTLLSSLLMTGYLVLTRIIFVNYLKNIYLHLFFSVPGAVLVYFFTLVKIKGRSFYLELVDLFKKRAG